jgi:hypothetical protein
LGRPHRRPNRGEILDLGQERVYGSFTFQWLVVVLLTAHDEAASAIDGEVEYDRCEHHAAA